MCLKAAEDFDEEDWHALQNSAEAEGGISPQCCNPGEQVSAQRPLAQYYDFIEVCGGSGVVSEQVAAMGFRGWTNHRHHFFAALQPFGFACN